MREKGQTEVEKTLKTPVFSRGVEILTEKIQFLYGHSHELRCKILENHLGGYATEIKNTYTNRSPLGHYFLLPNEIFTLGLNPGELSVYTYLISCEDRKTHQCWPSIGRISQHTGMSASTVAKYLRQLEDKRLIDVEPTKVQTKDGKIRNGTLIFTIRPIQEAVNYKLERELAGLPEPKRPRKGDKTQTRPCVALCAILGARWGNDTSETGYPPCWSRVGQLWASLAKPGQPRFENSPAFSRRGKVGRETEQKREKPVCDPV